MNSNSILRSGMDAVDATTEVVPVVCYIVSDLIYPLAKNNQPHFRAMWKYYRKANEQTDEPRRRRQLLQGVPCPNQLASMRTAALKFLNGSERLQDTEFRFGSEDDQYCRSLPVSR
jgi:hypothetical protein